MNLAESAPDRHGSVRQNPSVDGTAGAAVGGRYRRARFRRLGPVMIAGLALVTGCINSHTAPEPGPTGPTPGGVSISPATTPVSLGDVSSTYRQVVVDAIAATVGTDRVDPLSSTNLRARRCDPRGHFDSTSLA